MRLLTLLAGYAAGLAVAMKVRKDAGKSKLDSTDPNKSTLDKLVDEVKDIHETTYHDVKKYVTNYFADAHDFDSLKSKVASFLEGAAIEAENYLSGLQKKGETKSDDMASKVDEFFEEKSALLETAKAKGAELTDTTADAVVSWIDAAKVKLYALRDSIKKNIEVQVTVEKPAPKKAPAKKPAAKKAPAKKPQA